MRVRTRRIHARPCAALLVTLLALLGTNAWAQTTGDYRTKASGNWNATATWERYSGTAWVAATATPTSSDGAITILNGHTVAVTAGVTVDQVTVNAGGQVTLNSGITLSVANGTGTDLQVNGVLSSAGTVSLTGTMAVGASGTYRHNQNGGTIPTATWDAASTCLVTGITSSAPGGLSQTFGDFTWNCTSQSSDIVLGNMTTNGDFTLSSTASNMISLGSGNSQTLTVGGNYVQTGGSFEPSTRTNKVADMTVGGAFSLSGGSLIAGADLTVNVAGDFSFPAGGTLAATNNPISIVFDGGGTPQNFTSGGTISGSNGVDYTVNSGATLYLDGSTVTGSAFTLSSGGTLGIGSTGGIASSGATGNVQTTTRTFNAGANYLYNSSSAQAAGTALPATLTGSLTINNSAGVTLGASETLNGALALTSGALSIGTTTLTMSSTVTVGSGSISSSATGTASYSQASAGQVVAPGTYGNLTFSNYNKVLPSSGTVGIAGTFTTGSATGHTITGSTIDFTGSGAQTIPAFSYNNLSNSGNGNRTLASSGTVGIAGSFTSGSGTYTVTGSTVAYKGSSAQTLPAGVGTYNNLTINNAAGVNLGGNATVNGVLTFTTGTITTGADVLTLGTSASVSRTSGHVVGNFKKPVATGSSVSRTFEIGDATNYTPVAVVFGSVSTAGSLQASVTASEHPNIGTATINPAKSVNRYWTLTNTGTAFTNYSATYTFVSGDVDAGASTSSFIVGDYSGSSWTYPTVGTKTSTSTQATGLTGFGDFALGEYLGITTTTLASNANPSVYGQSVTLTATVTPGAATGTVTFKDGATTLGTGTLSGGTATYSTSALSVAGHSLTAVYGGDATYRTSTSSTLTQTVNAASTTTAVVSGTNPSVFGQSVTFTATVAAVAPGAGTLTGTVTFKDGAITLGTGTLSGGTATYSTSALSVASHSITAVYGGDGNFTTSTSSTLTQTVNAAGTTTSLASNANPSVFGQSVTLTATVTPSAATGTVTFKDGATTLGTGTLSGGNATFSTSALTVAGHSLTAVYGGDASYGTSTSSTLTQTVNQASTTTAVVSGTNPSVFGQSVTFTATVAAAAPGAGAPGGTVTFKDGASTLGTGTLSSGTATYSTSALSVAGHSITAVYGGDGNFTTSTSSSLTQTVNAASTTTAVVSSLNPSNYGQSVTFTATVSAMAPGAGAPSGTVTFKDGVTVLGSVALAGGTADLAVSSLGPGSHSISAEYGGDGDFAGSSASLSQTVEQNSTGTALAASPASPSVHGQNVTLTATVTPSAATGTVTFKDGVTTLGTGTLSGGTATYSTTALAVGSHSFTAVYEGDSSHAGSTSSAESYAVDPAATSTALSTNPNPSVTGESVTLTATVAAVAPGAGTPAGTVTFYDGATSLGAGSLSGGTATLSTTALEAGSRSLTASYAGEPDFTGSTSDAVTQTVNQGTNTIEPVSATSCITPKQSCATVPVNIARTDLTGIRSFAVTFTLSADLEMCAAADSAAEGTYLSAVNPATSFSVTKNPDGSYTADGAITGTPCGAMASSGNLFNLRVTNHGGSGTGSVTVTSVTLRDCAGASIPASAGAAASVTIDLAPVTVAAISAQSVEETATLTVTPSATLSGCVAGPASWTVSPSLPLGATLDSGTGEIRWTPACGAAGSYGPYTLTAQVATGETGSASFSITVTHKAGSVAVDVASSFSADETVALAMTAPSATLGECATGPVTWSIDPALPGGATFSSSTGVVSWTPACGEVGSHGPYTLTAHASSGESGTGSFSLVVTHLPGTVAVTPMADTTVAELATLSVTPGATASGCAQTPVTWSASGLPAGAAIDSSTGTVSWTPSCSAHETGGGVYGPVTVTARAVTGETGSASFTIHVTDTPTAASAIADLGATQVTNGTTPGSTTGIALTFTLPSGASAVEVYRKGFGNYPAYDEAPGSGAEPTAPAGYPPSGWTLTAVTTNGGVDQPPTRDFWYYVAYARNECGDVSAVSAVTAGALDYHLGDVSDGATPGTGDNLVNAADLSELGAHYGLIGDDVAPYGYLDVGPSSTGWLDGRPLTDQRIDFDDLVFFALNYGLVSAPQARVRPAAKVAGGAGTDEVILETADLVSAGELVPVRLLIKGSGAVQAVSTKLLWDPAVVEPVSFTAGALVTGQGGVVLSAKPGSVDAARLGVGRGIEGEGEIATVTFRARTAGSSGIHLGVVDARSLQNQHLNVTTAERALTPAVPKVTQLAPAAPNPFRQTATVAFSLAQRGPVELAVFSVDGRRVRTLVNENREPGEYRLTWDGRDDRGQPMAAGVYYAHLATPAGRFTRTLTYLR